MAIPKIKAATLVSPTLVEMEFDSALDTGQLSVPLTAFRINYGEEPVTGYSYSSNTVVALELSASTFTWQDRVKVSYSPPEDISLCLRGATDSVSAAEIRKVAVRTFNSDPVYNNLPVPPPVPGSLGEGYPDTGAPLRASVDHFILAYGVQEAIQLSNIEDPSADSVNYARIRMAIEDAESLIDSYITQAPRAGVLLISSNRRRTSLVIARYYLDSVRRREDVTQDYERAIKELQANLTNNAAIVPPSELAVNNGGIMRVWAIPQRFNSVSGKGFSGHWTDPGSRTQPDYREDDHETNNNTDPNWVGRLRPNSRPNDSGGEDTP